MFRRAHTRGSFVVASAIAVAAGCGLDAIATGPAAVVPGEAGVLTANDADVDADITVDGSGEPSEGSVVVFPPVDGGADGPTGLPGFCTSQMPYAACWDFDNALPGGDAGFPDMTTSGGATFDVVLEGANPVLQAKLPTTSGTRNAWVRYGITGFGQLRPKYQLDYKFGVRQSSLDYAVVGALWATTTTKAFTVGVASFTNGTFLDMVIPDVSPARLTSSPGPLWHTASITLEGPASAMHGVVLVDGVVKVDDETFDAGSQATTGIDLRLGAYYTSGGNGGVTFVFDDIVLRTP